MTFIPEPNTIVDRGYRLLDQLGEGGMGTVYRAVQLVTGQTVALKLVSAQQPHNNTGAGGGEVEREQDVNKRLALAREFQTLASLHHPNIIRVLSYGFDEQLGSYFTMELIESPQTILEAGVGQPPEVQVELVAQLLRALSYIHRRGIVHRDIKPSNVLVVGNEVKLLDFGIATLASTVTNVAGTIEYLAPELLWGALPSARSDLYAVGVILHQLTEGDLPHKRNSFTAVLDSLLGETDDRTLSLEGARLIDGLPSSSQTGPSPAESRRLGERTTERSLAEQLHADPARQPTHPIQEGLDAASLATDLATAPSSPLGVIARRLMEARPEARYESASVVLREVSATGSQNLPVETAATRESFLQATVFVGREREMEALSQALAQLCAHQGSAFLIGGESGVGKSRLLSEVRTLALVQQCSVVEGQSITEGGFLYHEWLPLFRALCFQVDVSDAEASVFKSLVPDLETLLGRPIPDPLSVKPEAALVRLASTLIALLKRQTKPLVLILEDLHWGRSESLALLVQVARSIAQLSLLLICTYRSDECPSLPATLPTFQQLQLQRLARQDIAQLSESMLGPVGQSAALIDYLARQTEGNVFFLVEIVRALAENAGELERISHGELLENVLTVGIGRIVERRLNQVDDSYRELLDFSATLGRKLDLAVLQRVFPHAPLRAFLLECANAAVLESQGSDWRFAHDKLRETLIQRMAPEHRQRLHLQIAETLESLYTGPERAAFAAALGHHYRQAGVLEPAFRYYLQAGDSALRVYAYEQARVCYAASAELLAQLPETSELQRWQVDVLTKQVQSSLISAPPDVNQQRLERARELLTALADAGAAVHEDRLRMARIDYYAARLHNYSGQAARAVPLFRRVLPVAHEFQDQELILVPSVFLGSVLGIQGQMTKAIALLEPMLAPMERLFGKDIETMRAYLYLAVNLGATGRHTSALALVAHVRKWVDEVQQAVYSGLSSMLSGLAMLTAGDWPAALAATNESLALTRAGKINEPLVEYLSLDINAWAQSRLGNHDAAQENRARAVALRSSHGGGMMKDWFDAAEAEIHLSAGRTEAALELAQKLAAAARPAGQMFALTIAERTWGCALASSGEDDASAEAHLRESLELANSTGMLMNAIWAELALGQMRQSRGDLDGAASHYVQARERMTDEIAPAARDEILRSMS